MRMKNNYDNQGSTSVTLQPPTIINMREQLAKSNYKLVEQIARHNHKKYGTSYRVSIDDMRSAGHQGLAEALESFNPEQGTPLGAYARTAIQNAMHNELRRLLPVDPKTAWDNGKGFSYNTIGDDSVFNSDENQAPDLRKLNEMQTWLSNWDEEEECLYDRLRAALKRLSPTDRDLIVNRFGFNGESMTLKQLSYRYNVSVQAVAKREKRILEQLRTTLDPYSRCA